MNRRFSALSAIALGLSGTAGIVAAESLVENVPPVAAAAEERAALKAQLVAAHRAGVLSHNEASLNARSETVRGAARTAATTDAKRPARL